MPSVVQLIMTVGAHQLETLGVMLDLSDWRIGPPLFLCGVKVVKLQGRQATRVAADLASAPPHDLQLIARSSGLAAHAYLGAQENLVCFCFNSLSFQRA